MKYFRIKFDFFGKLFHKKTKQNKMSSSSSSDNLVIENFLEVTNFFFFFSKFVFQIIVDPRDLSNVRVAEKYLKLRPLSTKTKNSNGLEKKIKKKSVKSKSVPYHKKISKLNKRMEERRLQEDNNSDSEDEKVFN